jgi:hypothetical protein
MKIKSMSFKEAASHGISRGQWIASVSKKKLSYTLPPVQVNKTYPCVNRGDVVRKQSCKSCRGNVSVKVLGCRVHGECVVRDRASIKAQGCDKCPCRQDEGKLFEDYMLSHKGSCYVFGSGKTTYNYERISNITVPCFYINQASQLVVKNVIDENYMFALDKKQSIYFKDFPGTLVLANNTPMHDAMGANPEAFSNKTVWYHNGYKEGMVGGRGQLDTDRLSVQSSRILYQGVSGVSATIMPLLHFIWYCGFDTVNMVGCDGFSEGYDPRLDNKTGQRHNLNCDEKGERFGNFRKHQDKIADKLGLTLNYL